MEIDDGVWVRFRADVSDIQTRMASLPGIIQGAASGLANAFNLEKLSIGAISLGSTLTQAISVPIANIKEQSLNAFAGFEASMNRVQAMTGETKNALASLNTQALELGSTTQFSATKIAVAMGDLASAGLKTSEIYKAIPGVLDFAAAGQMKLADAAKVATTVMHQYGMEAMDMGKIADVIAHAASKSSAEVSDMGVAFSYFGTIAKQSHISLQQTAAAFEILADAGTRGSKAGTAMRQMIANLENPSKKAVEAMDALGISVRNAEGALLPLDQLIENLRPLLDHTGDGFAIFGKRFTEVVALIDAGPEKFRALTKAAEETAGASKTMASTLMQGYQGELKRFNDELDSMKVKIGNALAPAAEAMLKNFGEPVVKMIGNLADGFKNLPLPIQQAGLAFTTVAQWAGPAITMLGQLGLAWPLITSGAKLAGTAIASMVPSLAALGTAAAVAATAFGAWKLGEWLYNNVGWIKQFGDALGGLILKIPGVTAAINSLAGVGGATKSFGDSVTMLEAKLKAKGVTIDRTGLSLEEYAAKLRRAAIDHAPVVAATERVTATLRQQPPAIDDTARAFQRQQAAAQAAMQASMAAAQKQIADAQAHQQALFAAQQKGEALKRTLDSISMARLAGETQAWAAAMGGLDAEFASLSASIQSSGVHTAEFSKALDGITEMSLPEFKELNTEVVKFGTENVPRASKSASELSRLWDSAITGLSRGLSDIILKGEDVGKVFAKLGRDILAAFVDQTIHAGIKSLIGALFGVEGAVGSLSKAFGGLGGTISSALGGASNAANGLSGGGGAGGAAGGLAGTISAIGAMGSMISGIVSNFQNARQETTLNAIEENTRYMKSYLRDNLVPDAQKYWPLLENTIQLLRLEGIENGINKLAEGGGGGGIGTQLARVIVPPLNELGNDIVGLGQALSIALNQFMLDFTSGIYGQLDVLIQETRGFRMQAIPYLQTMTQTMIATYNTMAKPGNGVNYFQVAPGQQSSGGGQNVFNVNVIGQQANGYQMGQQVIQGINSQLALR